MFKKGITLVLTFLLIISTFTFSTADETREADKVMEFTLEKAVNYALENNKSVEIADINIEKSQFALSRTKKTTDQMEEIPIVTDLEVLKWQKGYYDKASGMAKLLAQKSKEKLIEGLKFSVQKSYYDVLLAQEIVQIEKANLERAENQLEIVKTKFNLGNVTKLDVLTAESDVMNSRIKYEDAVDDLKYKKMNFNKVLGLPLDTDVILTDELKYIPLDEIDLEEKIKTALENRFEIIEAKEAYELEKINFETTTTYFTSNTNKYKEAEYDLKTSEYNLEQAKKEIELSVRKAYLDLVQGERNLKILEKNLEIAQEAYRIANLTYEAGLSTLTDVTDARNRLNQAELGYTQALCGYNLAKTIFNGSYGIGIQ